MAATHQTAAWGLHEIAWQIPDALDSFASLRRQWMDWRNASLVGRAAARQTTAMTSPPWRTSVGGNQRPAAHDRGEAPDPEEVAGAPSLRGVEGPPDGLDGG